ncbi:response regulator transcription factor [Vallitalea guaymasensis]|uniref:Stage 0 sporulation protein A homolog n=1 Tax=Vallitalea guaymasensis TaxID=1185412 RepID=A0A8J8SEJ7_9FIRM|nr:response regulator [Vallitalea guaymasensis]QUH31630.1 response regulator [Vallitalea guaymasensis]
MEVKLLRVLIVDDEEKIRGLLKLCLDWQSIGFEIVGEASSGHEALDILEDLKPDLIITDISMDFMDGLELCKHALERNPLLKVMILTAYNDFNYAKKGIELGVSDFLLKPIKRSELVKSLIKIKGIVESEVQSRNDYQMMKERLEDSYPVLKNNFLKQLIHNQCNFNKIDQQLNYFDLNELKKYAEVAVIELNANVVKAEEEGYIVKFLGLDVIKEYYKNNKSVVLCEDNLQNIVVVSMSKTNNLYNDMNKVMNTLMCIENCSVSIGISNSIHYSINIHRRYREAIEALACKVIYGNNQLIRYEDIKLGNNECEVLFDPMDEIALCIKAEMEDKASVLIEELFGKDSFSNDDATQNMKVLAIKMITIINNARKELGYDGNLFIEDEIANYKSVMDIETLPDMINHLQSITSKSIAYIKQSRNQRSKNTIHEIAVYLKENMLDANISLSGVAQKFYFNSSYLSRAFKQEYGATFIEYLTKLRIDKALELLNSTDLKSYEVCEKVGIPNPNYFGKCFKKHVGCSVSDYRNNSKNLTS